ncbi:phosphate starvation-inducible protein PsiF [Klebsiella pneumoniae subsp. pneumoniae]|nr:phosphate starvation-inducible protein PsiF [Klebsiella pneumoniae subsp. pneumoniae]
MKITLLMTLMFGLIFISAVGAAEKTPTPQQQRMTDCNQQASAKMLKGEERKTFMSQCLKKETTTSPGKGAHPSAAENERLQQSGHGEITEGR